MSGVWKRVDPIDETEPRFDTEPCPEWREVRGPLLWHLGRAVVWTLLSALFVAVMLGVIYGGQWRGFL